MVGSRERPLAFFYFGGVPMKKVVVLTAAAAVVAFSIYFLILPEASG
jgi:hypothetical protein